MLSTPYQLLLAMICGCFAITIHLIQAQDQQGFIYLDCGLPTEESPYNESTTTLTFVSDAGFIHTGQSGRIRKDLDIKTIKPYSVLRFFPDGKRNCYNLNVTQDAIYVVRAVFLYGNYDGQDRPPTFDLYLGSDKWETISFTDSEENYSTEIIYASTSNTLHICIVKTGDTTPFISSIEVQRLGNDTYPSIYLPQSDSLKLYGRAYFNTLDKRIRYPDDVHDREWIPFNVTDTDWIQLSTLLKVNNTNLFDVPRAVLEKAATTINTSLPFTFGWTLDNPDDRVYVYFHFAEIGVLRATDIREFDILMNGKLLHQNFSPGNLSVSTVYPVAPITCDGGECNLELVKTSRSTFPPLMNAIEAYTEIKFPQLQTNSNDTIALMSIQVAYGLKRANWQGDICLPQKYMWDGINCTYGNQSSIQPRIISLNISSSELTGTIAHYIQNLTYLQELDLSNNHLTGGVPKFLAYMDSLRVIILKGNELSGVVPPALLDKNTTGRIQLDLRGNQDLCFHVPCENRRESAGKNVLVPVIASIVSLAVINVVVLVLFLVYRKNGLSLSREGLGLFRREPSIVARKKRFSYSNISAMTNRFERAIGEGGFGVVYHGYVEDNPVAVKVLSASSHQGYKQFKAEVELLLRVHHINLVSLVGYCDEQEHLALVYEYAVNGNLKQHLTGVPSGSVLKWEKRISIAAEAALGLEYLHIGCKPPMIHRDIKSTNILLSEDFKGKLSDFGLSRSSPATGETHVSTVVVGTPGYLDPEYYRTNRLNEKSDVYSFGIVLLEIITNKLVIDQTRERPHIAEWASLVLTTGDIKSIIDPKLIEEYEYSSFWRFLELAMSCVNPSSTERPNMSQVVHNLNECLASIQNKKMGEGGEVDSTSSVEQRISFGVEMSPKPR